MATSTTAKRIVEDPQVASRRARELYKYFIPPDAAAAEPAPADTVLTAHAQLVAWRLQCQRAMVSLIDRDTQYFVAESTKTLNVADSSDYEDPNDAIWAGCVSVEKAGRLCEHTLQTLPSIDGSPACFEVLDLAADERFSSLPFVAGPPHFKYYCGVPLRSNGINIGSLFALDDKIREPASRPDKLMLSRMADLVHVHLETLKEKEDLKRTTKMNLALAAFVDPDNRRRKRKLPLAKGDSPRPGHKAGMPREFADEPPGDQREIQSKENVETTHEKVQSLPMTDPYDSEDPEDQRAKEDEHLSTFRRAAALLLDSLALYPGSGLVFLDTGTSLNNTTGSKSSEDSTSSDETSPSRNKTTHISSSSWDRPDTLQNSREGSEEHQKPLAPRRLASIMAFNSQGGPVFGAMKPELPTPGFVPIPQSSLTKLVKRHPRGKLFILDTDDSSGSSDDPNSDRPYNMPTMNELPSKRETNLLNIHFPGSRQVMFIPCWDPYSSRHLAFFAYNTNMFRRFAKSPDFLHCLAFCNCITTEISRLATLVADQQKSDFIGSVSHELRSPLHGILGSCEFLEDTDLTPFQRSLVDTADSCARTLLDTISMVLDYSKINAFERNVGKAKRSKSTYRTHESADLQPTLNIYGSVDLSAIIEEVLEGVARGFQHSLQDIDFMDLSRGSSDSPTKVDDEVPEVEIYLDMEPRDWIFITQPGAFRRIVMNLFGNALKYTRQGSIHVSLEAHPMSRSTADPQESQVVTLKVTDTGRGMSPHYMRTKLFTPFAQESSIAPGTGLGLSLVRSIVRMLKGEIDIQSTVGVGTEVTCKFPMILSSDASSGSTITSTGGIERVQDNSLRIVQEKAIGRSAMVFDESPSSKIVARYLTQWYGFDLTENLEAADLVVVKQADYAELLEVVSNTTKDPMIVVLCTSASRGEFSASNVDVDAISYPFGPIKLAKAIRAAFERHPKYSTWKSAGDVEGIDSLMVEESQEVEVDEMVQAVEQIDLHGMQVVQRGNMAGLASSVSTRSIEQMSGFPFPVSGDTSANISPFEPDKPVSRSLPATPAAAPPSRSSTPVSQQMTRTPRVLLVDDNKINLKLLQTFMRKRGYNHIFTAEDGAQAVTSFKELLEQDIPPQLIFMDVSMPVMDGFQSTRHIRELEAQQQRKLHPAVMSDVDGTAAEVPPSSPVTQTTQQGQPCTIIALTGLASTRDQNEAFMSGMDLYLTKPIPFKEVAKLLDNWERTGGSSTG